MLIPGIAATQTVELAELERCAALASAGERLECFETLARGGAVASEVDPDVAAAADNEAGAIVTEQAEALPDAAPAAAAPAVKRDAPATTAPAPEAPPTQSARSAGVPHEAVESDAAATTSEAPAVSDVSASPAPASSADAASATVATGSTAAVAERSPALEPTPVTEQAPARAHGIPESFGQEHLGVPQDEDGSITITATVVDVEQGRNKVLYFTFTNGQVWRQIEGRRFSYPKNQQFDVEIKMGMMGDYRLRLASGGSMTRIRRLK